MFTLNDKTIALECSDDFLSAREAGKRAEVFLEFMRIGRTEGSMTECSTTVNPYDQLDRYFYCSSCSEYSTDQGPHDQRWKYCSLSWTITMCASSLCRGLRWTSSRE